MKQQFSIQGMSCNHCVAKVEETLQTLPGVQKVKVNLKKAKGLVKFDESQIQSDQIKEKITALGYPAEVIE